MAEPKKIDTPDRELIAELVAALGSLHDAIDTARDRVPDDDEGTAAMLFCQVLNAAQKPARAALRKAKEAFSDAPNTNPETPHGE